MRCESHVRFCESLGVKLPGATHQRNGFWLLMKRLEADRFVWPRDTMPVLELTIEQLHWLLDGIDLAAMRKHPARHYARVN
jgi:transposase